MTGNIQTPVGPVPLISSTLTTEDKLGEIKVRLGIGRGHYRVQPGLYGIGSPTKESVVLVSANYKLSFDTLREQLTATDAWILVLDTKGINVWCAAGKGTFGTDEMVARIASTKLAEIVSHRNLIVPQLGAPGVAAFKVKQQTGFTVEYGPVHVKHLPAYIENGHTATRKMRKVTFTLRERLVLAPVECVMGLKKAVIMALSFLLASGLRYSSTGISYSPTLLQTHGLVAASIVLCSFVGGIFLSTALLPWLPGRSFSARGAWLGLAFVTIPHLADIALPVFNQSPITLAGWYLIVTAMVSFLCQNFTGSSTFTSLSGVEKEIKTALPLQAIAFGIGSLCWAYGWIVR